MISKKTIKQLQKKNKITLNKQSNKEMHLLMKLVVKTILLNNKSNKFYNNK